MRVIYLLFISRHFIYLFVLNFLDGRSGLALLHGENRRAFRYGLLRFEEKKLAGLVSACVASHAYAGVRFYRRKILCW